MRHFMKKNLFIIVILLSVCGRSKRENLDYAEYDAITDRLNKPAVAYKDEKLTLKYDGDLNFIGHEARIKSLFKNEKGTIVEVDYQGQRIFLDRQAVHLRYKQCEPFSNKKVNSLAELRGLIYTGSIQNSKRLSDRGYESKLLELKSFPDHDLTYTEYSLEIAGELYDIYQIEEVIAYCGTKSAVLQIRDFVQFPHQGYPGPQIAGLCRDVSMKWDHATIFLDATEHFKKREAGVMKAWRYNIDTGRLTEYPGGTLNCHGEFRP